MLFYLDTSDDDVFTFLQTETEDFTKRRKEFDEYWSNKQQKINAKVEQVFPGVISKAKELKELMDRHLQVPY